MDSFNADANFLYQIVYKHNTTLRKIPMIWYVKFWFAYYAVRIIVNDKILRYFLLYFSVLYLENFPIV